MEFHAGKFWGERLRGDWDLKGVGYSSLGLPFNIWMYKVRAFVFDREIRKMIEEAGFEKYLKNLNVVDPLGYFDFLKLISESKGVITDSGGIQEETSHM